MRTFATRYVLSMLLTMANGGLMVAVASADETPAATVAATYDGAAIVDASGGLSRAATYVGNLHLRTLVDLERALGWNDSHFLFDALWIHGGRPDAFVGDAMGVSNIAARPGLQVEEMWVERNVAAARLSALVGLYDLNSEFYRVQSAGLFLNSAFGIGPEFAQSGVEGPSIFPRTSVGARLAWKPLDNVVLRTAVLDGVPLIRPDQSVGLFEKGDGLLVVTEVAVVDRSDSEMPADRRMRIGRNAMLPAYDGKFAIGAWHFTTTLDRLDDIRSPPQDGTSGAYAVGDLTLARDAADPRRRLSLFAQLGIADDRVNRFSTYVGGGVVAAAPFSARPDDELGVAVGIARNGSPYQRQVSPGTHQQRAEATVEISYLAQATSRLAIQPDLQYVLHPDTDPRVSDALVFTLRFEVGLH